MIEAFEVGSGDTDPPVAPANIVYLLENLLIDPLRPGEPGIILPLLGDGDLLGD